METVFPLRFYASASVASTAAPSSGNRLASIGLWLRRHRQRIALMQWGVALFYGALVVLPAVLPLPSGDAHLWDNLRLFAQFVFWGLWWPGVMLATVSLGRVWCGLFCPEGFLSELASRHGRGKAAPTWLKWRYWPFIAFVTTTIYGQLVSVYQYAEAALLILGGSTLVAVLVGFLYGHDKRVWCRYLCPASGVFAILAKIAPLHYKVDRAAWDHAGAEQPFNCPPLVDVRRMSSASDCHACARCAGQRDAVQLAPRSPFAEILRLDIPARATDAYTLIFGVMGIATAAFQWTVSPWFLNLKMTLATWLVEHESYRLLDTDAPWWLLTHYPEVNDAFTWLDGILVLTYLLGGGVLLGALLLIAPHIAARLMRHPGLDWKRFALTLTPMGAASVILGLTMTTATQLRGEHLLLLWLPHLRVALLGAGVIASLWLAFALIRQAEKVKPLRRGGAFFAMTLPVALMTGVWGLAFFVW
ncbi:4Fe-4S binding domain-containing protein [Betaproteobacteria bacterium]|nr:4Fe-4S binding domain-containing protein [Betaproteobacteria bacterium]GHU46119.1 4Fe-4S binding domain-containing protein [Betaproteobacteria bacterium]